MTVPGRERHPVVDATSTRGPTSTLESAGQAQAGVRARTAPSPPATRAASTTAPRRCCVASAAAVKAHGLKPLARDRRRRPWPAWTRAAWGSARCPPPGRRSHAPGCRSADLDLVELNEAFAAQAHRLHPASWGSTRPGSTSTAARSRSAIRSARSGARILTTLVHALRRTGGRYGWPRCASASGRASRW